MVWVRLCLTCSSARQSQKICAPQPRSAQISSYFVTEESDRFWFIGTMIAVIARPLSSLERAGKNWRSRGKVPLFDGLCCQQRKLGVSLGCIGTSERPLRRHTPHRNDRPAASARGCCASEIGKVNDGLFPRYSCLTRVQRMCGVGSDEIGPRERPQ